MDYSQDTVSFAVVSGDDIEKVKVEFDFMYYEPATLDDIGLSLQQLASYIREMTELALEETDDE